jgi:hypothetical protein
MRCVLLALVLFSVPAFAVDTSIRVLGVYPSNATIDPAYMRERLANIVPTWTGSNLHISSATTVEVLNNNVAVPVTLPGWPASLEEASKWAASEPAITQVRAANAADVIILFLPIPKQPPSYTCGVTQQFWHDGLFNPDQSTGLDLNHRSDGYVSVVGLGCHLRAAVHEFGHLLGGAHVGGLNGLYPDSHEYLYYKCNTVGTEPRCKYVTGALTEEVECPNVDLPCSFNLWFSRNVTSGGIKMGDGSHQNVVAMNKTARSAANFWVSSVPIILNPPISVSGQVTQQCSGGRTYHRLSWIPDSATNVTVSGYEVWYRQPANSTDALRYSNFVAAPGTYVDGSNSGSDSRLWVKTCTSGYGCSALSSQSYLASFLCTNW